MPCKPLHTDAAPAAIGPYSQAMEVTGSGLLFLSGQIALVPGSGELLEGDVVAQAHQVMRNLEAVLKGAGLGWEAVAKTTVFLTDMGDFAAVNEVYGGFFDGAPPARSTVAVAALPVGFSVEIEVVAAR